MSNKLAQDLGTRLAKSRLYREYERAFGEMTGMPLSFRPTDSVRLPFRGNKLENQFCCLLAEDSHGCVLCLDTQDRLRSHSRDATTTEICHSGLADSAVPVRLGNRLIGYLQTGQIALSKPTRPKLRRIIDRLAKIGVHVDPRQLETAYFATKVVPKERYNAVLHLLGIFAQHLALAAERIALEDEATESPAVRRAKAYIQEHQHESVTLKHVATATNVSTYYFCKIFKQATGFTFTEYLSLTRISKARSLLLDPHLQVSEVAYAVGFNSLTHFNRVFKKIVGQSPTAYRSSTSGVARQF